MPCPPPRPSPPAFGVGPGKWKLSVACTIPVVCKQEKGASSLYGRAGSESAQTQGCEQQGGVRGGGLRGGGQEPSAHRTMRHDCLLLSGYN